MPVTSTGSLTSTMTMHVSEDQIEDIIFGRDWFNYCSAEPFATMDLIEPGMCLCFGALPQSSIRACSSLGQILMIPLLCLTNELSIRKHNSGCQTMFVDPRWFLDAGRWCPFWPWCRIRLWCLGIGTGNPGVFPGYPYPYPSLPVPAHWGTGFCGYGSRVLAVTFFYFQMRKSSTNLFNCRISLSVFIRFS
jgi:hypothetical protein